MSDKWETVGKNSPRSNKNGKKPKKPMPKLEDILPHGSLVHMYTDLEPEQQQVQEQDKKQEKEKQDKKQQQADQKNKAAAEAKKKKDPPPPKPKIPKDINEAVRTNLRVDDIRQLIDSCQTKFPDSPLLWLRDLASYLNIKLVNEGSSDFTLFGGLPCSALSPNMKKAIQAMVEKVHGGMQEVYTETCVANIGHEMAKNLSVLGWIVVAQVLAETNPSLMVSNVGRLIDLRNSYQNRPAICITILKALGEAGKYDLQVGLKLWMEIMLPLLSMKHYSKFVVEYITKLLDHHKIYKTSPVSRPLMDISNFLTLQDTVFVVASQINKEYSRQLSQQYPRIKNLALGGYTNHELFPAVINKLKTQNMPDQVVDSLDILTNCLLTTPAALVHWQKLYISQLAESGYLLQYLNSHWNQISNLDTPLFRDTIQAFQEYNETAGNKDDVVLCREGCAAIIDKLSRKNSSMFPWKTLTLMLMVGTGLILHLDVKNNLTFDKSHVGAFLKDLGQYERVCCVVDSAVHTYDAGYTWAEKNLPEYYAAARTYSGPVLDQVVVTAKDGGEIALVKLSELAQILKTYGESAIVYIETQAPGAKESASQAFLKAQTTVLSSYEVVKGKVVEMVKDVDWDQVKSQVLLQVEAARTLVMTYFDKVVQQVTQLVK